MLYSIINRLSKLVNPKPELDRLSKQKLDHTLGYHILCCIRVIYRVIAFLIVSTTLSLLAGEAMIGYRCSFFYAEEEVYRHTHEIKPENIGVVIDRSYFKNRKKLVSVYWGCCS